MLSTQPIECPEFLLDKARSNEPTATVIVNAASPVAMQSAKLAVDHNLIEPIFIGDQSKIKHLAQEMNWDIENFQKEHCTDDISCAKRSVSLAREGEALALMKGNIHTDDLLRAVLDKDTGIRTSSRLSHVFHMTIPNSESALCITDAVVNIQPDVKTKLSIARNAITLMHALGNPEPNIAVLSATEVPTPAMPSSMEAAVLVRLAEMGEIEGAVVGGPFAFDNAVSPEAAKIKGVDHPGAGSANVVLVPNIETGNALFKQMVYFMSACAAGLVLGAKVPIALTSRADPPAARLASAALASIYAAHARTG